MNFVISIKLKYSIICFTDSYIFVEFGTLVFLVKGLLKVQLTVDFIGLGRTENVIEKPNWIEHFGTMKIGVAFAKILIPQTTYVIWAIIAYISASKYTSSYDNHAHLPNKGISEGK